jgi:hypothetical protein
VALASSTRDSLLDWDAAMKELIPGLIESIWDASLTRARFVYAGRRPV